MAFIRNPQMQDAQSNGANQNLLTGGESTVAGNAQAATQGQTGSKAQASPNAWYNVTDFLNANQKGGQKLQNTLQTQGQGLVSKDATKSQEQQAAIGSIVRPQAVNYSEQLADTGTEEQVNQGLQQDWLNPQKQMDYSQYNVAANKDISGLEENSYGSLTNFAKSAMPKRANYTMGAQRMDEALLGRDPNFVQNFAKDLKGQYASQVTDPLAAKITEAQGLDTSTDASLDAARAGMFTGLEGYLGGKQSAVNDTLAKQRSQYDAQRNRNIQEELYNAVNGIETKNALNNKNYLDLRNYVNQNAGNYSSFSGIDPNQQTAAWQALGDQGVGRYNTLAGILGQNQGKAFDQMSSQKWQDPTWNLRSDDLRSAAQRQSYQNEMPDIANQIQDYNAQLANLQTPLSQKRDAFNQAIAAKNRNSADTGERNSYDDAVDRTQAELGALESQYGSLQNKLTPWQQRQSALSKYLNG